MLPKEYRLSAKEFPLLYKKGFKSKGKYGMLICLAKNTSTPSFGYVVSKKIGNSVKRHRMTRLLRAISMDFVKEKELNFMKFQYIAFEFCDDFTILKEEFGKQLKYCLENIKHEKNSTVSN